MGDCATSTGRRRSPTNQANALAAATISILAQTATVRTAGSSGSDASHPSHTSARVSGTTSVECSPATSRKSQTALATARARSLRFTSDHATRVMRCSPRRSRLAAVASATLTRRSSSKSGGAHASRSNGVTSGFRATAAPVGATSLRRRNTKSTAQSVGTRSSSRICLRRRSTRSRRGSNNLDWTTAMDVATNA